MDVDVIVEIPKGSRNKYEFDHALGRIRLDRMLFTSTGYPADYGFVPGTMAEDELFGELPPQAKPQADAPLGAPRLREPQRDQVELRAVDIESLIGEDHPVRVIWAYVEGLDLSELENRIKARGARPGGGGPVRYPLPPGTASRQAERAVRNLRQSRAAWRE